MCFQSMALVKYRSISEMQTQESVKFAETCAGPVKVYFVAKTGARTSKIYFTYRRLAQSPVKVTLLQKTDAETSKMYYTSKN